MKDTNKAVGSETNRGTTWTRLTGSVFGMVALGGILLWFSQPPVGLAPLAWIATVPWVLVIIERQLPGRKLRRQIWMGLWMYWLLSLYFIPIPHPLLWIGWPLLAAYEATVYFFFFATARHAIWAWRFSPLLVVPTLWVAWEWLRTQTEYGFGMLSLSHTQFRLPLVIQVADIAGAYGLSFLMMLFATGVAVVWKKAKRSDSSDSTNAASLWGGCLAAFASLLLTVGYGWFKLNSNEVGPGEVVRQALVIQGSIDTVFPKTAEQAQERLALIRESYRQLTINAREAHPQADLLFWPEGKFPFPLIYETASDAETRAEPKNAEYLRDLLLYCTCERSTETEYREPLPPIELITGIGAFVERDEHQFNSVWQTTTHNRYDKNVRVPFGEFLPIWEWFPNLEKFSPIGGGLTRTSGARPMVIRSLGSKDTAADPQLQILPNVCFESLVPQVVRRHVRTVEAANGQPVDWLANFTDDGWFYGTSCLDLHLASTVFRSVEMRKPTVVAANTGFSAEIDHRGRVVQQGPRRAEGFLLVKLTQQPYRASIYRDYLGDTPWMIAALFAAAVLVSISRRRSGEGVK